MKLPEFSVKQPVATLMIFFAIILLGFVSLSKLNIDLFPEIEPPVISILTTWPGASASDVETEVTKVIEDKVNSVNNLDTLSSKSLDSLSAISCKFEWGTNLDVAINDVRDKLELTKKDLPRDIEPSILFKFSSASMPIMYMTVTGEKSWLRLYYIVDKKISDELRRVPGVGAIVLFGGLRRRINVYFDMKKIEGYGLSIQKVNQVLAQENLSIPAGSIKSGTREYFVRVPSRYKTMDEIRDTIIGYYKNNPVYFRDVAEIEDAYKPEDLNGWAGKKKAIVFLLQKQTGKNTVAVVKKVKEKLKEIQKTLPSDIEIVMPMNQAENIMRSVNNLSKTFFEALIIVILITLIFLRKFRPSIIIALTIPFSLIVAFIFLYLFGYTINLISLMALTIALVLVVDDGIVALENIIRHIERGGRVKPSAIFGASEMGMAMTASTLTVVVVFVPLMFITGLVGIMFKQFGFVLVITLLASLFTALSMTPMLSSKWISEERKIEKEKVDFIGKVFKISEKWFNGLENGYKKLLQWALGHRKTVIALAVAIFLSSISLIPFISTEFMPETDTGDVNINFRLPEGTRIEETNRVIERILKIMDKEVKPQEFKYSYAFDGKSEEGVSVALGREEGPNVGEVGFKLVDRDKRKRSAKEIAYALRKRIKEIPEITRLKVSTASGSKSIMMGGGKPVCMEIQGSDLKANNVLAKKLKADMEKIPGLVDISVSQKDPRPELWIEVDKRKASSIGLSVANIAETVHNYFYGKEVTDFRDAGESYDVFTRFTEEDKNRLKNLPYVPVFTPDGKMIRLKNLARIVEGEGPIEIERKNRQRIIKVEADTFRRSLGDVTADIKTDLEKMEIPEGISTSFGGEVYEQKQAFRDLTVLLILGIILVYMVLASLYGNLRDPFIIMFSVPFAFSGVFYAYYFTDTTLSLISFMGIIMLMGIVVKNAVILIDYIRLLQKRREPLFEAVVNGGRMRLRPILMTAFAAFFGLLPMTFSQRVGAEVWNPLGMTMVSGLFVSTLVTLVLVPTIYYSLEKRKYEKVNR